MKTLFRVAIVCLAIAAGCISHPLQAQIGANLPFIQPEFFNSGGNLPCGGCLLYSYSAGTTVPLPTFSDYALTTPNPNPLVLDSTGRPLGGSGIFLSAASYKFVLKTASGATIWSRDNIYDYGQQFGNLWTFSNNALHPTDSTQNVVVGASSDPSAIAAGIGNLAVVGSGGLDIATGATANEHDLKLRATNTAVTLEEAALGAASHVPLKIGQNGVDNIVMNSGSLGTGGNTMVWNPPYDGFANTIDVGLFSGTEAFKGTKFLVQVYTNDVDPVAAHTAIDGAIDYKITNGSSGVGAGVLGHAAIDPGTGVNITSGTGVVGVAGIAYTLPQPSDAQINLTNTITGINGRVTLYAAGTTSAAYAASTSGPDIVGNGIIDQAYGLGISGVGQTFAGGHANHSTGLWIGPITFGTVDNYAIRSDGGNSYHVGNVFVGAAHSTLPDANTGDPQLVVANISSTLPGEISAGNNQNNSSGLVGAFQFVNYNIGAAEKRIAMISAGTDGAVDTGHMYFQTASGGFLTQIADIDHTGYLSIVGRFKPGTLNVANLGSAATFAGSMILVNDSTAIASEGQACVGGSSHLVLAFSDGVTWKCF